MHGFYLHVPFCRQRCLYCDFFTGGARIADWNAFSQAAIDELDSRLPIFKEEVERLGSQSASTIYFGGGTPSLLPADHFQRLAEHFLRAARGELKEFTIEVNPEDVTPEATAIWRENGVTRVSMGVQSLVDTELKAIGRRHSAAEALRAYDCLRKEFDNVSLDLIFGLPGQDLKSLARSLDGFLSLRPEHLSAYSLMYEERTALTALRDQGRIEAVEDTAAVEMFELISARLEETGYIQYELSNYALPGRESVHNSSYWKGYPYLGIGPSAHSYDGGRIRRANRPELLRYLQRGWSEDMMEKEILDDDQLREEMIMTRLRMRGGLDLEEFERRFGRPQRHRLLRKAEAFIHPCSGVDAALEIADGRLALTRSGIMISDEVMAELF